MSSLLSLQPLLTMTVVATLSLLVLAGCVGFRLAKWRRNRVLAA